MSNIAMAVPMNGRKPHSIETMFASVCNAPLNCTGNCQFKRFNRCAMPEIIHPPISMAGANIIRLPRHRLF